MGVQMNMLDGKPVVHLYAHQDIIPTDFGGDLVELINAPSTVNLPDPVPQLDAHGHPWVVDVKNFGPGEVTVVGKGSFTVQVLTGKTVSIKSLKGLYILAP
jgi:hypothetical protein